MLKPREDRLRNVRTEHAQAFYGPGMYWFSFIATAALVITYKGVGSPTIDDDKCRDPPLEPKHKVFLSHSGAQKSFVEQLCLDLEKSHHYPFFDKRADSLPKGEKFPDLIFQAAQQCQVAIVVLSEDFFTRSKWPMLELDAFVRSQKSNNVNLKILPLFYKLSQSQCCEKARRARWMKVWHRWARHDHRIDISSWKDSLEVFGPTNGLSFVEASGEVDYRKEVVEAVCRLVPPEITWDDSHVQARSRICEVIRRKFDEVRPSPKGIQVVGLYGMGGLGKTTACKSLCNEFFKSFSGKVCHAELGKQSANVLHIEMLKQLTDTSHNLLKGLNEDKSRKLLLERIGKDEVFLTLDNVWDTQASLEQAKTYLKMNFRHGSMVIVTARTLDTLSLLNIEEKDCLEMPELEEAEATSLFLHHASLGHDHRNEDIKCQAVKHCVQRCYFRKGEESRYHYLPLALKVLGIQLGTCGNTPSDWADKLDKLNFNQFCEKDHPIFSILRTSFDVLPAAEQLMFMDVALFPPECSKVIKHKVNICEWLSIVHRIDVTAVKNMLQALRTKSLLDTLGDGYSQIRMHDLYREFAQMEAKAGDVERRRWLFITGRPIELEKRPAGLCWPYMQRVAIRSCESKTLENARLNFCSNVVVLKLVNCTNLKQLNLQGLDSLVGLELHNCFNLRGGIRGLGDLKNLAWLRCMECFFPPTIGDLGTLTALQVLELNSWNSELRFPPKLHGCINLRVLTLSDHSKLTDFPDLRKLVSLQKVTFTDCPRVTTITGFCSNLSSLRYLNLSRCVNVQDIRGLGYLTGLEELNLDGCKALRQLSNMDRLTNLQILDVSDCNFKELPLLGNLRRLQVLNCSSSRITRLPNLSPLMELRNINLSLCRELASLCDIGELTALRHLNVIHCPKLAELPNLSASKKLETLYCWSTGIRTLPHDFQRLATTVDLKMAECEGLVSPLLALLKHGVHGKMQKVVLKGLRSCYWKRPLSPGQDFDIVIAYLLNLVSSKCKDAVDLLSTMCWPDYEGFYWADWHSDGAEAVDKVAGGVDIVIRALCEHDDLNSLTYVIAALAATEKHWITLRAPSTLEHMARAIVQFLKAKIEDEIIFGSFYVSDVLLVHKTLVALTADSAVAKALGEQGGDYLPNRLLSFYEALDHKDGRNYGGTAGLCRSAYGHDPRIGALKERFVVEAEAVLVKMTGSSSVQNHRYNTIFTSGHISGTAFEASSLYER